MIVRWRWLGKVRPLLRIAVEARSSASLTAAPGRPINVVRGCPRETLTSTSTGTQSIPTSAQQLTLTSIGDSGVWSRSR